MLLGAAHGKLTHPRPDAARQHVELTEELLAGCGERGWTGSDTLTERRRFAATLQLWTVAWNGRARDICCDKVKHESDNDVHRNA